MTMVFFDTGSSATATADLRVKMGPARQLSSLDVQLLDAETHSTPLHIGGVVLLEAQDAPLSIETLRGLFAQRLHLVAPLRRRLRTVPLGLDLPYWQDNSSIDLDYHVREVSLSGAANEHELTDLLARLHAVPLDRDQPLWECHLVSGLPGGGQAVYLKSHHALIDGLSVAEILAAICDVEPRPSAPSGPAAEILVDHTPGLVEMLGRSVPNSAARQVERIRALLSSGPAMVRTAADLLKKHPDVPFNRANTANRSIAFASVSLDDVKAVKRRIDGTVNDVVMALCATAIRRWLLDHDDPVDRPILVAIPVSVRDAGRWGTAGNQFSIMLCDMPVEESDPHERLELLRERLVAAKQKFNSTPPAMLIEATALLTPLLNGAPTRVALRAAAPVLPFANALISNVPGPQIPLYVAGIRVVACHPISMLTDLAGGLNITVMSYNGKLDFGILACPDTVPDANAIAVHLSQALAELMETPTIV
ncbi:wax ester/triacylglycerol synthase family O-acyltransferase [Nocardia sp. NPDC057668]|uniref:wax ester/triacylglycerol synthase family O-acyltransferase n=1 Tax=Nocardia sp. NPDC057668 TaxID=3346202 RepID=UPI00366C0D36